MTMSDKDHITELQAEISRLKSELEKAQEQAQELEKSRRATLFMIEDLNISTAQVERAKNEWEATFDSISAPLFIHDKELRIVRANKAYAEAGGMSFSDIIRKKYFEVFPKMEGPFKMCLKTQELQEEEEYSCPVTNRIFNVRFYPIKDTDGKLLYSIHIMEDITEAKRAAERLKEAVDVTTHLLMIAEATAKTTDIDKLMGQVMQCGHKIMGCDVCLSYLWDKEARVFRPAQCYGLAREFIPIFRTELLDEKIEFVRKAMEGKEPVIEKISDKWPVDSGQQNLTTDYRTLSTVFSWLPDINTAAVIPLIGKTQYLGLIISIYVGTDLKSAPKFTDRDKKLMQGISHQVSTAIEEARLYKETVNKSMELSHKIETIQVMHEIDRSILSTLEVEEILETVTRLVSKVISCDRATVSLVDKERQGFIYKAGFGVTFIPKGQFVPFKDTSAAEVVVKEGRINHISNLAEVKGLLPLEEKFLKDGFLSHIRLPLLVKGEVTAVLSVGSKRPSAFTPEDLSTLEKIASQIGVALENARLITDLEELFLNTIKTLSSAIDAKSPWTRGHSERVTGYALSIAREMKFDEKGLKDMEIAGLLHDIGKLATYEAILDKPGRLNDDELKMMRMHPGKGAEILAPIKQLKHIIPAIKYHHEFYDGKGYPEGLKGEAIPLSARIMAVADTVDAMGADRPYRKGRAMDVISAELKRCSGTQFDPNMVETFLKISGER